jgi:hypothetical protein
MVGPVDYIVVGFDGNNFDGSIVTALTEAVSKGIIRVVDLLFIIKDHEGTVVEGELEDQLDDTKFWMSSIRYSEHEGTPLIAEQDIFQLGEQMPLSSSAMVLVIEHLWAKNIKRAMLGAGGDLLAYGRIQPDAVETAMKELETTTSR